MLLVYFVILRALLVVSIVATFEHALSFSYDKYFLEPCYYRNFHIIVS